MEGVCSQLQVLLGNQQEAAFHRMNADLLRLDARLAGRPSGLPMERSPSLDTPSIRLCSMLCVLSSMDCSACPPHVSV